MTSHNHLLRSHAPIPVKAWETIDAEAQERLVPLLASRRIADLVGPGGWTHDALSLGRTTRLAAPPDGTDADGVQVRLRRVQPLAEVRVPFVVAREEIDDIQRGSRNPELDDLARAARVAAEIENRAVLHGWADAGIDGITQVSARTGTAPGPAIDPEHVAAGVERLRGNGIEGPYSLVLSPDLYAAVLEADENGHLLLDHLVRILDRGPLVRAPGLDGAVVLSARGEDFLLDVGQDLSIGYSHHDAENVHLYLEGSFTFLVAEPDAAVVLG